MPEDMNDPFLNAPGAAGGGKGKTIILIVLGVLFVAAAAGAGYMYMQAQRYKTDANDKKTEVSDLETKNKDLTAKNEELKNSASKSTQTSDFIVVTELGFKLPTNEDIKDLVYFINKDTVFFSSKSLMSSAFGSNLAGETFFCSPAELPLGAVTKFKTKADAGPDQVKELTGFVLGFAPSQAACSKNAATAAIQTKQKAGLLKAFNSAEVIQ